MKEIKKPSPVKDALRDAAEIVAGLAMFGVLLAAFLWTVKSCAREVVNVASKIAEEERAVREECVEEAALSAETYLSGYLCRAEKCAGFKAFSEDSGEPAPDWYRPEEPMSAEWFAEDINVPCRDIGCSDPHYDSLIWGWDGHSMAKWEMDLFSRIFYLEFWQPNLTLCEAGCDAMLGLWDLNGGTVYETISHINDDGSYSFSTYPGVWEEHYDPDGLAWCLEFCEERFCGGPVWTAQYFRKEHYHDWGEWSPIPAYEIDGIYFSIGRER